jgi:predicted transcriptional regulator
MEIQHMPKKVRKQLKTFRLSNYVISELDRLADELQVNRTAVVELAISAFCRDQYKRTHNEHRASIF